jgi:hypothetical protein
MLCVNPLLEGFCTGDFERRIRGALEMEHLTLKRPRERASREASFTGDPRRCVKKDFGYGNLHMGPFTAEVNLESGGSYTGDFERCMKEGSSNRASFFERLHEGDLEGGLL